MKARREKGERNLAIRRGVIVKIDAGQEAADGNVAQPPPDPNEPAQANEVASAPAADNTEENQ